MNFNVLQLYKDYHVSYQTEGHKHCRPGWANIPCPFCTGNPGLHLGVTVDGGRFYCWRCGWHPASKVMSVILNKSEFEAKKILRQYAIGFVLSPEVHSKIGRKLLKFPSNTTPLQKNHIKYLENKRHFDAAQLEERWGLMGTNVLSMLDGTNYAHRILCPVYWDGKLVTFQCRDITDKHKLKYLACNKEREVIHHKDILYGMQEAWGDTGICVEGITDVWRLGFPAFATFGIEYTHKQIRAMKKHFKRVFVLFDDEPQAVLKAEQLVSELQFRGVFSEKVSIYGDPGGMAQADANYLVKELTQKIY